MRSIIDIISKKINDKSDQNIIANILGAFAIKGGALFVSLLTMPAFIRYFDNQFVLGFWFTLLSVMIWILSFDLGIGNGLRNKLVEAIGRDDRMEIKAYISSAYVIISGIVIFITICGFGISYFVEWNLIFKIPKEVISESTMLFTVRCVFLSVMLQFLLRLITSILYAMQKSALTNLLSLITSIAILIFVLLTKSFDLETNLIMLSLAYLICVNVPLLLASVIVFKRDLKNCAPNARFFKKNMATSVLYLGGVFFWNQIMYMVITVTNEFFITQFTEPAFVVDYQIYNRLFTIVGSLFMLALMPMWSAITKAVSQGDAKWLHKIYRILNYSAILAIACEILMIPILQILMNLWLGQGYIEVDLFYASAFAVYGSVFIYQSILSTMVCGMGKMRIQAICYTAAVVLKFPAIYLGMMIFHSWIVVIIVNIVILLPYCIIQPKYIKKHINDVAIGGFKDV